MHLVEPDAAGDRVARVVAAQLYAHHASDVRRWVNRLAGIDVDVEDMVQEVFLAAHRKYPSFRGDSKVSTWLFGIVQKVVSRQRARGRWARWFGGFLGLDNGKNVGDSHCLEEILEARERVRLLYRAMDGLPEKQRTALVMFEIDGLAGEEIARLVGCSIDNVWVRIHRGRARLTELVVRLQKERFP